MPPAERWTDERLDDLARLVDRNDKRVDGNSALLAAHDLQLIEIERRRRVRGQYALGFALGIFTVLLGQIATIVTVLITAAHHAR